MRQATKLFHYIFEMTAPDGTKETIALDAENIHQAADEAESFAELRFGETGLRHTVDFEGVSVYDFGGASLAQ